MKYWVEVAGAPEAFEMTLKIPEFKDNTYPQQEYEKRLGHQSLVLIAYFDQVPVGFKAGYPRGPANSFYSWIGGVLPEHRKRGVARMLASHQEQWALENGFTRIWFKTRNHNRAMLHFALNSGFYLKEVQPAEKIENYRIILEKTL